MRQPMEIVMAMNPKVLAIALAFVLTSPMVARGEEVGTSCADCPSYSGAYSIENETGVIIPYQFKWGDKHPWQDASLASGHIKTHSYPLGEDKHAKAPTPLVRFDKIGGDAKYSEKDYRMEFHAVGYAGFGPHKDTTEPKRYYFKYGPDGKHLDL